MVGGLLVVVGGLVVVVGGRVVVGLLVVVGGLVVVVGGRVVVVPVIPAAKALAFFSSQKSEEMQRPPSCLKQKT